MKIIAESPEEDRLLNEIEKLICKKGYTNVYSETFAESFLGQVLSEELAGHHNEDIKSWTPAQRLIFYSACNDYFKTVNFKQFKKEYDSFVGIYASVFKNEQQAFQKAIKDFVIFKDIQKSCEQLDIDNYKKLGIYLKEAVVKGKDKNIKNACSYYDKDLSQYVMEINSIKVPFIYKQGKINEEPTIYGWSDADFYHSFEFLRAELMFTQNNKKDMLDFMITDASNRKVNDLEQSNSDQQKER